jgi:chemotaxis protein methyltransferase WspC
MIQSLCTWITQKTGHKILQDNMDRVSFVLSELAKEKHLSEEQLACKIINNAVESQLFIDQFMTTESYFMRYLSNMKLVARKLIPFFLDKGIKPHILSIPCARGEEPYSLSMILIDEGISLNKVNITGLDISHSCIKQAKKGTFSAYSFRRLPKSYIKQYFTKTGRNTFTIQSNIRSSVNFIQGNILTDFPPTQNIHVIFCHNLFIYFNQNAINQVLKQFDILLDNDGWLFVDSSEGSHVGPFFKRKMVNDNTFVYVKQKSHTNLTSHDQRFHELNANINLPEIKPKHFNVVKNIPIQFIAHQQASKSLTNSDALQIDKGITAYQAKNFSTAIQIFQSIIKKNSPYKTIAHMGLAKIYADNDNNLEALENAELSLDLDQESLNAIQLSRQDKADLLAIIAIILQKKGMMQNAHSYYEKLKALDDQHPALIMEKG